jgi:hypothetical protein
MRAAEALRWAISLSSIITVCTIVERPHGEQRWLDAASEGELHRSTQHAAPVPAHARRASAATCPPTQWTHPMEWVWGRSTASRRRGSGGRQA